MAAKPVPPIAPPAPAAPDVGASATEWAYYRAAKVAYDAQVQVYNQAKVRFDRNMAVWEAEQEAARQATQVLTPLAQVQAVPIIQAQPVPAPIAEPPAPPTIQERINAERDRRIGLFRWQSHPINMDDASRANIRAAMTLALAAIGGGKQPGDLRWSMADTDYAWIAADNAAIPMDAQTALVFATSAEDWATACLFAARTLKDMNPIPENFADDQYWPRQE